MTGATLEAPSNDGAELCRSASLWDVNVRERSRTNAFREATLFDWLESLAEEGDTDRLETLRDRIAELLEQEEDDDGSADHAEAIQ